MSLILISERPADKLLPLANALVEQEKLSGRQYRVWYLKNFTPKSLRAITIQMQREGYLSNRGEPVSMRTLDRDLEAARRIIDRADLKAQEAEGGRIELSVVVQHGHRAMLSPDWTARGAHDRMGVGLHIEPDQQFKLAA